MKRSLSASIPGMIGAALVLAACGTPSISPSVAAPSGFDAAIVRSGATSPCRKVTDAWYFHGSCAKVELSTKGGTFALAPYHNITLSKTIGKNTVVGKQTFVFGDATGAGDITGKRAGAAFIAYGTKACVIGLTCPGTAVVYASDVNDGVEVGLLGATTVTVTDTAGLPGKKLCFPAVITKFGWIADPTVGTKPTGNSFTISFPADKLFLESGQTVLAYACE